MWKPSNVVANKVRIRSVKMCNNFYDSSDNIFPLHSQAFKIFSEVSVDGGDPHTFYVEFELSS